MYSTYTNISVLLPENPLFQVVAGLLVDKENIHFCATSILISWKSFKMKFIHKLASSKLINR